MAKQKAFFESREKRLPESLCTIQSVACFSSAIHCASVQEVLSLLWPKKTLDTLR